jgi:hypothetical protein
MICKICKKEFNNSASDGDYSNYSCKCGYGCLIENLTNKILTENRILEKYHISNSVFGSQILDRSNGKLLELNFNIDFLTITLDKLKLYLIFS